MEHDVMVWGKSHKVRTYKKSKSVWVASGKYNDESITTQDRSESTALKRWREAADYRGN
ncbi:MAG TPA: hypothetical protein VNH64_09910 [Parvularculaceae bacterium]|nr:hypothetical protein [Parvularculaceae bacterium]